MHMARPMNDYIKIVPNNKELDAFSKAQEIFYKAEPKKGVITDELAAQKSLCLKFLRFLKNVVPNWAGQKDTYEFHFNAIMRAASFDHLRSYMSAFGDINIDHIQSIINLNNCNYDDIQSLLKVIIISLNLMQYANEEAKFLVEEYISDANISSVIEEDLLNFMKNNYVYNSNLKVSDKLGEEVIKWLFEREIKDDENHLYDCESQDKLECKDTLEGSGVQENLFYEKNMVKSPVWNARNSSKIFPNGKSKDLIAQYIKVESDQLCQKKNNPEHTSYQSNNAVKKSQAIHKITSQEMNAIYDEKSACNAPADIYDHTLLKKLHATIPENYLSKDKQNKKKSDANSSKRGNKGSQKTSQENDLYLSRQFLMPYKNEIGIKDELNLNY